MVIKRELVLYSHYFLMYDRLNMNVPYQSCADPENSAKGPIRESPPQFENRIMARVYVRSIMRINMYHKAPFY